MSKIYEEADAATNDLVQRVVDEFHPELAEAQVSIAVIMVHQFKNDELVRALKMRGTYCVAMIRLTRAAQRVFANHDVELLIDACSWADRPDDSRKAIIDHELTHIKLRKDRAGGIARDDRGRPKISFKPDDFTLTGFYEVVRRHGSAAVEHASVTEVFSNVITANSGLTLYRPTIVHTSNEVVATFQIVPQEPSSDRVAEVDHDAFRRVFETPQLEDAHGINQSI